MTAITNRCEELSHAITKQTFSAGLIVGQFWLASAHRQANTMCLRSSSNFCPSVKQGSILPIMRCSEPDMLPIMVETTSNQQHRGTISLKFRGMVNLKGIIWQQTFFLFPLKLHQAPSSICSRLACFMLKWNNHWNMLLLEQDAWTSVFFQQKIMIVPWSEFLNTWIVANESLCNTPEYSWIEKHCFISFCGCHSFQQVEVRIRARYNDGIYRLAIQSSIRDHTC